MLNLFKKKELVAKDTVNRWAEFGQLSPDLLQLAKFEWQLVFFPDEFQVGHPKNELIKDQSVFQCKAESIGPFVVWKKNLGEESYPIPMKASSFSRPSWQNPHKGDACAIRGEIHAVKPITMFPILDKHRQNGLQFTRERIDFICKYREQSFSLREGWHTSEPKTEFLQAWMYVGISEFWRWEQTPVCDLASVRMFKPNDDKVQPYYQFTPVEYDG